MRRLCETLTSPLSKNILQTEAEELSGFPNRAHNPRPQAEGCTRGVKPDNSKCRDCNIFRCSSTYHCFFFCFYAKTDFSRTFSPALASTREFVNVFFQQIILLETSPCTKTKRFPGRGQTLLSTNWKTTNLLFQISKIDVAKKAHRQDKETNTYQTQIAFSTIWTRQKPRGLVGSSVISDPAVPGSSFTAVSSLFLRHFFSFKVRTAKHF